MKQNIIKNYLLIIAILAIAITSQASVSNTYFAGIGSADDLQIEILAVIDSSIAGYAATYNNMYNIGIGSPVGGSNVEILVIVKYGEDVNIQRVNAGCVLPALTYSTGQTVYGTIEAEPKGSFQFPYSYTTTTTDQNELTMHVTIYRFTLDTLNPIKIFHQNCIITGIAYYTVQGSADIQNKGASAPTVIENPANQDDDNDDSYKEKPEVIVISPNSGSSGHSLFKSNSNTPLYSPSQIKGVFKKTASNHTDQMNLNIDMTIDYTRDSVKYDTIAGSYISNNTLNHYGVGDKTYYIVLRSKLQSDVFPEGAQAMTYFHADCGFYSKDTYGNVQGLPQECVLDKDIIDSEADTYISDMMISSPNWTTADSENARLASYSSTAAHEIAHALGHDIECYSSDNCIMRYSTYDHDHLLYRNLFEWNVWDCPTNFLHGAIINLFLYKN